MNGRRYGCININDMYKNDVGKGGAQCCEAYEVKQRVALVRVPFYFINLLPTSLLYISILLTGGTVKHSLFRKDRTGHKV